MKTVGERVGGVAAMAEQAGVQLLAQLLAIQTRASPLHSPCAAHVGHVACVSVPQVTGGVGTKTGAGERGAMDAVAHAGLQLQPQFCDIHTCAAPVHCPEVAQAEHMAFKSEPEHGSERATTT
jgi:hypothetical protein